MTATTGSRDIVRRAGARPASTAAASERRELWRAEHLSVPGTGHIHFTALPSDDDLAAQLARRVAADPSDARLHVARVNHHVVDGTPDGTFAALVDVFFAFGASGRGLRSRLLEGARRQIGATRAALLQAAIDSGLRPKSSLPWAAGSMLSNGVTGSTDIVRPVAVGGRR